MFSQKYANNIRQVSGAVTLYDDDVVLDCITTAQPCAIPLDEIVADHWNTTWKLYINDKSGLAATNNIVITAPAGFKINGVQSVTINTALASVIVRVINNTNYIADCSYMASGGITSLPVNNTVFVMKNGDDSTGLVQRLDKPFFTIAAARAAATAYFTSRTSNSRVLIVVETGLYVENIILDKFIDYDLNECVINGGIIDNGVDFGSTTFSEWTNVITGKARVYNQTATGGVNVPLAVYITMPNSKVLIYCDSLGSQFDDAIAVENGNIRVHCNRIYTNAYGQNYYYAIEAGQGFTGSDYSPSLIEIYGADIYASSDAGGAPIGFNCGGSSKHQTITLINCRVRANNNAAVASDASAINCGRVLASDGTLNLYNTTLYSSGGDSINVENGSTLNVYYYHSNMANVAAGGAGTLNNVLTTTLTVNSAIPVPF